MSTGTEFRDFTEAREFVRTLALKNQAEWREWSKNSRPADIPSSPHRTYADSWHGFGDWLGTFRPAPQDRKFLPFGEARAFVRSLDLKNQREWHKWHRENRPAGIPRNPHRIYADSWRGLGDWLGTFRPAARDIEFRPFEEAREFARSLGLRTESEWREWSKNGRPADIPYSPPRTYPDSWRGWRDWLGTEHLRPNRELSLMLVRLSTSKSQTNHARFEADPAKWWRFHELFRKSRRRWPEEPVHRVARLIRNEVPGGAALVDLGCGECLLRDELPEYETTGVDHVAYDSGVVSCDMAQTPLADSSFDAAVFCLSLLGHNWPDYLSEARRLLRPGGRLFIVESPRRWERMKLEAVLEGQLFTGIRVENRPRRHDPRVPSHLRGGFVYARALAQGKEERSKT